MPKRNRDVDPIDAAREAARAEVARHWPDLVEVEPTVTRRQRRAPGSEEQGRLGAAVVGPAPEPAATEYTFTFASHIHTADGYTLPRIARVTVDSHCRVVKATTSK